MTIERSLFRAESALFRAVKAHFRGMPSRCSSTQEVGGAGKGGGRGSLSTSVTLIDHVQDLLCRLLAGPPAARPTQMAIRQAGRQKIQNRESRK